jgi:two-component system LytT family response regulator
MKRLSRQLRAPATRAREERIVVTTSRGALVLSVGEIDWIEAAGNYARIWMGGRGYLLREPLRRLELRVRAHGFLRAHRRALVRLDCIRELQSTRTGELVANLGNGVRIPISRRRRAAFTSAVRRQDRQPSG